MSTLSLFWSPVTPEGNVCFLAASVYQLFAYFVFRPFDAGHHCTIRYGENAQIYLDKKRKPLRLETEY